MSDREWRFYLDDMIRFGQNVLAYTSGMEHEKFVSTSLNYDATLRNLELIGEAATHIPDIVRDENPDIPWRMIIATRNRLIHAYLGIDNDTPGVLFRMTFLYYWNNSIILKKRFKLNIVQSEPLLFINSGISE